MITRILKPEEWENLNTPDLPRLLSYVEPQNIAICVVEIGTRIVASVYAMQVTHFEGLWIDPEYRGHAGVFRSLIRQAYAVPRVRKERFVFGGAEDGNAQMDSICTRLGGKPLPVKFYAMPVGE